MANLFSLQPGNNFVDWINQGGNPATERNLGGVVPAYPIFMFIGIMVVIVCCVIQMKRRRIPLAELEWGILITVPAGILGATIFGKIFIPNIIWYHIFFFWEPGMSLFGSLFFGFTAGFAWFYRRSKVTKISFWVYADCILPNILLGQAIGRWGNFYNHEILGMVVNYDSLSWLLPSIRDKLWYFPQAIGEAGPLPNYWWSMIITDNGGVLMDPGQIASTLNINSEKAALLHDALIQKIEFRQPLFLYESLLNLFWWIVLTFLVSNLSRFFQKKGKYPWDLEPKAYPGWYNHKYKSLPEKEIISWKTQTPIKYKRVLIKNADGSVTKELKVPFFKAWNKAYYLSELDDQNQKKLYKIVDKRNAMISTNENAWEQSKITYQKNVQKIKKNYHRKLTSSKQNKALKKQLQHQKKLELSQAKKNYQAKVKVYRKNLGGYWYKIKPNPLAKEIEHAFNPNHYFIVRCGVLSGGYVFGYTLYRLVLETFRQPREYFIQNYPIANFTILSLIVLIGLGLILWAQLGAPYKYRDLGWLYEKSY